MARFSKTSVITAVPPRAIIERNYGSFSRSFTLPSDLKLDSVKASFDKGVLTVWVAKKEPAMHKEQEIKIS